MEKLLIFLTKDHLCIITSTVLPSIGCRLILIELRLYSIKYEKGIRIWFDMYAYTIGDKNVNCRTLIWIFRFIKNKLTQPWLVLMIQAAILPHANYKQ